MGTHLFDHVPGQSRMAVLGRTTHNLLPVFFFMIVYSLLLGCRGGDGGVDLADDSWRIEYELKGKIFTIRADGEDKRFVQEVPKLMRGSYWYERLSPAGDRLAFVTAEDGEAFLVRMQ